jgi:S-adenosylmethionine synthetase
VKIYSFSEQVSPRHSDKIADQIADALLDAYLQFDPHSKTAIEVFISKQFILIGGEINSRAQIDIINIVREVLLKLKCTYETSGIDPNTCEISIKLNKQSRDIALSIFDQQKLLSGDQSITVGYATDENEAKLP